MRCVFTATDVIVIPHTARQPTIFPLLNTNYLPVCRCIHMKLRSPVSYHWWSSCAGSGTGCGVSGLVLFECFHYHNCQLQRSYAVGDRICVLNWRSDSDSGRLKYAEKNWSQCHFAYHKSHLDGNGAEIDSPRWEVGS